MAEGLILEFEGVGREAYDAVNGRLGIDQQSGQGNWPPGIVFHAGGASQGVGSSSRCGSRGRHRSSS
jgi:hypothetical protein